MTSYSLIIDGQKVETADTFDILNPATRELVGKAPIATKADLDAAVAAADKAFQSWSRESNETRKQACLDMAKVLEDNMGELSRLLTMEQGKPLGGMGSEFEMGACMAWAGAQANFELPVKVIEDSDAQRIELHRQPLGVVASITPWNWPLMIAIWHIVPAIRTGNTVVLKPSPFTPLSTIRMVELLNTVLPAGVLNVVTGTDELGQWMTDHDNIKKVVFTGSCATGKKVMQSAAGTMKRLTLELGGNDAAIVLPDTDVSKMAEKIFGGAFINSGQTCAAIKRLYVHDDIYDEVCETLTKIAEATPVGNGLEQGVLMGPIQNKMQYDKVVGLVEDAKTRGARILCGGEPMDGPGYFYPLTLVADISDGTRLVDEEQFGPVLPIIRYSDLDEVIGRANNSEFGLSGSVWSSDLAKATEVAKKLECGTSWVNAHALIAPHVPMGGVKSSGMGVEFGEEGLAEYTDIHVISIDKS
ncbi:aldehyde dehydrogenase family protein [Emcibacter nanhaiensis]|uniref:Aldehyde dehydrogenase family protein n=1 Tax=Emcibacter nanhaiensis TaxID=1505037 RepID=A0A501PIL1_9PROT|nr:aldehyde dehydrogenase family protein [Emcibacter nanhaiensis]TPD59841.1 aldehyde dehydrogenase family protein [Emcibacter nanhaiensis]